HLERLGVRVGGGRAGRLRARLALSRAGVTQLAECQLPKLNVAGSNPVSRSTPALSSERPSGVSWLAGSCPPRSHGRLPTSGGPWSLGRTGARGRASTRVSL